jgi:hypothetical protein
MTGGELEAHEASAHDDMTIVVLSFQIPETERFHSQGFLAK